MDDREQLRLSNEQWQQDDADWQQEIQFWQQETQRLVALLYMLEKTLPEHSSKLQLHKARIDRHNKDLTLYHCGLEKNCLPDCPSHISLEKQKQLHKIMEKNHQDMRREHAAFSKEYRKKMRRFRELAQQLMQELEGFD